VCALSRRKLFLSHHTSGDVLLHQNLASPYFTRHRGHELNM
jgi:hypothetical protein